MGHCLCVTAEQADQHQQDVEPFPGYGSNNKGGALSNKASTLGFDTDSKVRIARSTVHLENGVKYTGQWLGDKRDGEGTQEWPDGARFEGQWSNGLAHGHGKFTHHDGDVYEGQWVEDKATGEGVYHHSNESTDAPQSNV